VCLRQNKIHSIRQRKGLPAAKYGLPPPILATELFSLEHEFWFAPAKATDMTVSGFKYSRELMTVTLEYSIFRDFNLTIPESEKFADIIADFAWK
jgi:hypothetical protein